MFNRVTDPVCRASVRHPYRLLVMALVLAAVAYPQCQKIRLDTNLKRLLPGDSRAVRWSNELADVVGEGGYFSIILEGDDREALLAATRDAAAEARALPEVHAVDDRKPVDFIRRFMYLLLTSDQLRRAIDVLVDWRVKDTPLDLGLDDDEEAAATTAVDAVGDDDVTEALRRLDDLDESHVSPDGRIHGLLVYPRKGVTSLGVTRDLFTRLSAIARDVASRHGVWAGVGGSSRNKVDIYDQLVGDLKTSGTAAVIAILITLGLSFGSLRPLPVLVLPLLIGLVWSFALVPLLVGSLNMITSFLLMVLFGTGVEYSVHLVKRFALEIEKSDVEAALTATYRSTGRSILVSGLTTAVTFTILCFSSFRGFSEFGAISASSVLVVMSAMLLVLPAAIVVGHRFQLIRAVPDAERGRRLLPQIATVVVGLLVALTTVTALRSLRFDYDFASLQMTLDDTEMVKVRHRQVFVGSRSPAAIYAVENGEVLDRAIAVIAAWKAGDRDSPTIDHVVSVRDFVPDAVEARRRMELLSELQLELAGGWVKRVSDPERRRWLEEARDFVPPPSPPTLDDLPPVLRRGIEARDGSGELLLAVYPSVERKNGRNAMAFTEDLYGLAMPEGVRGPTGETPVFAEVLWLATGEGPWIVGLTLMFITALVLLDRRSIAQTLLVMMPLLAGFFLTLGTMAAMGWKLNFFNIVVLPAMLGLSVDQGVHYYRRWLELGRDTEATQRELVGPLTSCAFTTIMGYGGLMLAHHPGLRSIGLLAVLGLICCWITAVVLLPGCLLWRERKLATMTTRRHHDSV